MKFENSETLQNLINAFAGESQARNRYTFYAKQAQKEGLEQIAAVFLSTADNEYEHAKLFYKHIPNNTKLNINTSYPYFLGETVDNLFNAAMHERDEWEVIYKNSAQTAADEGFDEISRLFNNIVNIEKHHSHRFETLGEILRQHKLFNKEEQTQWVCRKCGHILISKNAPDKCPVCEHPQGYFEIFCEKY